MIKLLLVGAGQRGLFRYGAYLENNKEEAKIVAVADPKEWNRNEAAKRHSIEAQNVYADWKDLINKPKIADAAIIATQDDQHIEPAIALMEKGYHILLEKPMSNKEEDCRAIVAAAKKNNVTLSVCHVLRYTQYFRKIREIVLSGELGQIATVNHQEQVGYFHQAHSYVRGNWRNSKTSSPMILAKSCHDMDIILFMTGKRCLKLSSFGNLKHFKKENKPVGASSRCWDCKYAKEGCAYSAVKYYMGKLEKQDFGWPLEVLTTDYSEAGVVKALKEGPYGRCVYECDNDVVDHQVVAMELEGGISVNFTMTAFTSVTRRKTEVFGSNGELYGDGKTILTKSFLTGEEKVYDFSEASKAGDGHLGGDAGIMSDFIDLLTNKDQSKNYSNPDISLESHLMAFLAEKSRINGTVESL